MPDRERKYHIGICAYVKTELRIEVSKRDTMEGDNRLLLTRWMSEFPQRSQSEKIPKIGYFRLIYSCTKVYNICTYLNSAVLLLEPNQFQQTPITSQLFSGLSVLILEGAYISNSRIPLHLIGCPVRIVRN